MPRFEEMLNEGIPVEEWAYKLNLIPTIPRKLTKEEIQQFRVEHYKAVSKELDKIDYALAASSADPCRTPRLCYC